MNTALDTKQAVEVIEQSMRDTFKTAVETKVEDEIIVSRAYHTDKQMVALALRYNNLQWWRWFTMSIMAYAIMQRLANEFEGMDDMAERLNWYYQKPYDGYDLYNGLKFIQNFVKANITGPIYERLAGIRDSYLKRFPRFVEVKAIIAKVEDGYSFSINSLIASPLARELDIVGAPVMGKVASLKELDEHIQKSLSSFLCSANRKYENTTHCYITPGAEIKKEIGKKRVKDRFLCFR